MMSKDIMISGKKLPVIDIKKNLNEALKVINQKKLGIVVVLKKKYISGLISDGDLRRGMKFLSKKKNYLENLMTKNPLVANENMSAEKALSVMNEKKITSLLVVSDNDFKRKKKMKLKGIIHISFSS